MIRFIRFIEEDCDITFARSNSEKYEQRATWHLGPSTGKRDQLDTSNSLTASRTPLELKGVGLRE